MPSWPASHFLDPDSYARIDVQVAGLFPQFSPGQRDTLIATTVAFLQLCAGAPGQSFAPSPKVDEVFHTMVLNTKIYRRLCRAIGVRYIDHEPVLPGSAPTVSVARTIDHMKARGLYANGVDELWPREAAAKCCGSCAPA